jgi:chorismate dehydratase
MRIAAVRYINALPLLHGLEKNKALDLSYHTPAICYERLTTGQADVGLIPIIGTQLSDSIRALKGLGIAAAQKSESVLLFAKKPLDRLERVLTDQGSMTSVMLLKIILRAKYGISPHFSSGSTGDIYAALRENDAALVIGDGAILAEKSDFDHYDLATEWYSLTRLPFVFAIWGCSRPLTDIEKQILNGALEAASHHWDEVYRKAGETLDVKRDFLERYYNDNLHYRLTRGDYEGILKYFDYASQFQFLAKVRKDIWL